MSLNYQPMKTLRNWLVLLLALILSACGGGGGDPGATTGTGTGTGTGTTTTTATASVVVSFANASGQAVTDQPTATTSAPLTAKALVKDKDGKVVANALVAFSTDNTLAVFSPSAGTALTNSSGIASVTLRPVGIAVGGAGTIKASSTVASVAVAGEANYTVGSTTLSLGALTLAPASITAYGSTDVSVNVLAAGSLYTDQKVTVNFSSGSCVASGKASMVSTASTNAGVARVVYRDLGCGNTDIITASIDGVNAASSATLAIGAPTVASIQFTSATPTNQSIVIAGQGGNGRLETATLTFTVLDNSGNPAPGKTVNFSTTSTDVTINPGTTTGISDASGKIITTVNSGSVPTSFRIKATLATNNSISTLSDSVVVTTGLPVQRAFSLSVVSHNVEGWTYDSGTTVPATNVNVSLADQAGNPVPDGTPIVFQANMGAVGSSSKGACNTVNGGCSVDFRTQAPRVATLNSPSTPCNGLLTGHSDDSLWPGLATVCASTTDGLNTLFSKVSIFFSGSFATNVFWLDGPTPAVALSTTTDLGSVGATDSKVFSLLISDLHLNPMPSGSTVTVTNITNATVGGVAPATVQDVSPHTALGADDPSGVSIGGNQGTIHTFTIASAQPKPCTGPLVSTFNATVTTPKGNATSYPFTLRFTCP